MSVGSSCLPLKPRLNAALSRFGRVSTVHGSNVSIPVVLDPDIQPGKDSVSQREYLTGFNHNVPKIFAALYF